MVAALLRHLLSWLRPTHHLALDVLALRHQLTILKRQTHKPKLRPGDRLIWIALKRFWPGWKSALMIFRPETVIGWQRAGFGLFWRWKSRRRIGRPGKYRELIELIRRKWAVNPTRGSPWIRDELAKLGLHTSTTTLRKYRPKSRGHRSQSWWTFLQKHPGVFAAMDFFVVPTARVRLLCVLVVIRHV
jgi:putative transposase